MSMTSIIFTIHERDRIRFGSEQSNVIFNC